MSEPLSEVKSSAYPDLERVPGKQNWVDKAGGLPSYIERIAKHLHYEKGMTISHAIATAVNTVKRWCSGATVSKTGGVQTGGGVSAATRAKACAAVAQWEAKKKRGKVSEALLRAVEEHADELSLSEATAILNAVEKTEDAVKIGRTKPPQDRAGQFRHTRSDVLAHKQNEPPAEDAPKPEAEGEAEPDERLAAAEEALAEATDPGKVLVLRARVKALREATAAPLLHFGVPSVKARSRLVRLQPRGRGGRWIDWIGHGDDEDKVRSNGAAAIAKQGRPRIRRPDPSGSHRAPPLHFGVPAASVRSPGFLGIADEYESEAVKIEALKPGEHRLFSRTIRIRREDDGNLTVIHTPTGAKSGGGSDPVDALWDAELFMERYDSKHTPGSLRTWDANQREWLAGQSDAAIARMMRTGDASTRMAVQDEMVRRAKTRNEGTPGRKQAPMLVSYKPPGGDLRAAKRKAVGELPKDTLSTVRPDRVAGALARKSDVDRGRPDLVARGRARRAAGAMARKGDIDRARSDRADYAGRQVGKPTFGFDPEVPGGFQDADIETRELEARGRSGAYTQDQIDDAKAEIKRAVMVRFGGDLLGPALVGVDVSDEDARRYLDGASIDELLPGGKPTPGHSNLTRPEVVNMLRGFVGDHSMGARDAATVLGLVDDVLTSARNFGREESIDTETLGDYFEFAGHPELAEKVYGGKRTPGSRDLNAELFGTRTKPRKGDFWDELGKALKKDAPALRSDLRATPKDYTSMDISDLSDEIRRDWANVNFAAAPYLDAMRQIGSVSDSYGADSGRAVVSYFLSNAGSWRGPKAKAIKAELRKRLRESDVRTADLHDALEEAFEALLDRDPQNPTEVLRARARVTALIGQIDEAGVACPPGMYGKGKGKGKKKRKKKEAADVDVRY